VPIQQLNHKTNLQKINFVTHLTNYTASCKRL